MAAVTLDVRHAGVVRGGRMVVHDATFVAQQGELLALMGASGSGKTTVLRAIAGLDPLVAGAIDVGGITLAAGQSVRADARRTLHRSVGVVFQFHHLFAHMTVLDNVTLAPVHVLRQPRTVVTDRARSLLDALGVGGRAAAMPHELSGGEAQRVAIARALAVEPSVLLMDEPTASLDRARREELAASLKQLAAQGRTIVIATHDETFAHAAADRVVVMHDGRMTQRG